MMCDRNDDQGIITLSVHEAIRKAPDLHPPRTERVWSPQPGMRSDQADRVLDRGRELLTKPRQSLVVPIYGFP